MNFKTTIILIVLLALGGIYLAYDRINGNSEKPAETAPKKVIDIDPATVTQVKITPSAGKAIVLVKQDAKWKLTEPVQGPADQFATEELVRGLVGFTSKGQTEPAAAKYDVEITAGGKTAKYGIGEKAVVGDVMYVQPEGASKAEVVPAEVYDRLEKVDDLRDKQLVTVSSPDVKQVRVEYSGNKYAIVKTGANWKITEPEAMPADESAVTDLLGAITGLRATDFATAEAAKIAGLDKPELTVNFSTAAPATQPAASQPAMQAILFGRYDDIRKQNVYVTLAGSNVIAKVPATSLDRFKKTAWDLRDKKIVEIDPESVTEIDIQKAAGPTTQPSNTEITLVRLLPPATKPATTQATIKPAPKWAIKNGNTSTNADDAKVTDLLSDLRPLKAEKFLATMPTTQPTAKYAVRIMTGGLRGMPVTNHELTLIDRGEAQPMVGQYNGLTFEVNRAIAAKLSIDFVSK